MPVIELKSFNAKLGARLLIDRVDATFDWTEAGDLDRVIALMGPSGSGKTTLARAILTSRYESSQKGLTIDPSDVTIAYVPQAPVLFPHMSAERNARMFSFMGRYQGRFDAELFEALSGQLRLKAVLDSTTNVERLSGGEAQRLMLLRTLSVRPDLIILDEPASGLDPAVREAFLIDLQDLLARLQINALYITHHWDEVAFLASRVAFAVTGERPSQGAVIESLPLTTRAHFERSPPTIDAFKTVYGPGCSVWPVDHVTGQFVLSNTANGVVSSGALACFSPEADPGPKGHLRAGEFRLARAVILRMRGSGAVRAAIYRNGHFDSWAEIGLGNLQGD